MKIHLRDYNPKMVEAWKAVFKDDPDVEVSCGEIFAEAAGDPEAVVSPANSLGFMDGGIDAVYSEYFGWDLQERLQDLLRKKHDGLLPVGQAVIVPTNHQRIPFLVSAPTMTVPMFVSDTINAYLAMRAALRAVREHNQRAINDGKYSYTQQITTLLCPGLGTAVGRMDFTVAAKQMHYAYLTCCKGQIIHFNDLTDAWHYHEMLRNGK